MVIICKNDNVNKKGVFFVKQTCMIIMTGRTTVTGGSLLQTQIMIGRRIVLTTGPRVLTTDGRRIGKNGKNLLIGPLVRLIFTGNLRKRILNGRGRTNQTGRKSLPQRVHFFFKKHLLRGFLN